MVWWRTQKPGASDGEPTRVEYRYGVTPLGSERLGGVAWEWVAQRVEFQGARQGATKTLERGLAPTSAEAERVATRAIGRHRAANERGRTVWVTVR